VCKSAAFCITVGYEDVGAGQQPLAESWNGASWTVEATTVPTGFTTSLLNGLSCLSTTSCVAVGGSSNASSSSTLVEGWNGVTWAIQPSPTPANASTAYLAGSSCTSAAFCVSVGWTANVYGLERPLAEQYS
jgi:hypothetical protein